VNRRIPDSAPQPFPDLTVQELFFYIDPDCLGDQGKKSQRIGADILDQLSIGRLIAWGREADRRSGSPLSEIAKTYWRDAHLTYWYFSDGFREEVHVEPIGHTIGPSYRDLQFNRAQAEAIWTPESRSSRSERIGAFDAFLRILESSNVCYTTIELSRSDVARAYQLTI
jgi:hypothetical protein